MTEQEYKELMELMRRYEETLSPDDVTDFDFIFGWNGNSDDYSDSHR